MSRLAYIIVFALVLLGNIILPSFFKFQESILVFIFLITFLMYGGAERSQITWMIVFSIIAEAILGLRLGSLALTSLLLAIFVIFINRFIQIQPVSTVFGTHYKQLFSLAVISAILYIFMSVFFLLIEKIFYGIDFTWQYMPIIVSPLNTVIYLIPVSLIFLLIFVWLERFKDRKKDYA